MKRENNKEILCTARDFVFRRMVIVDKFSNFDKANTYIYLFFMFSDMWINDTRPTSCGCRHFVGHLPMAMVHQH